MAEGDSCENKTQKLLLPPAYGSIYPGMPEDKSDKISMKNGVKNGEKLPIKGTNDSDNNNHLQLVMKAVDLAARRHRKQRRKDIIQTPYINHPIGVAYILTNEAKIADNSTIIAAILHDCIEDTKTTEEEIKTMFGDEVLEIVKECSVDKDTHRDVRKKSLLERAPKLSYKAKLVELADKLYNLRDIERATPIGWSHSQKKDYFIFCKQLLTILRGTNAVLEMALDDIINKNIK